MMKFEDIQRQGEKEPFGFDFFLTAEKKTAEVQVFLDVGERAFGLDGAVDTQEFAFGGSNFFFHGFPLTNEPFGNVQDFVPFFQWFLAPVRLDALFFQRTLAAAVAFIYAGGRLEPGF